MKKAFESVNHKLLICRLKSLGFNGKLLNWFCSYLKERSQCVILNGVCSKAVKGLSGVPQGFILGPLLFIIFIDEMIRMVDNSGIIFLYADDAKIARPIVNYNDCAKLQDDLAALARWSEDWGLSFNPKKCQVMSVTRARRVISFNYFMNNISLTRVSSCLDLGLTITNNLSWDIHVKNIIKKANQRLGLVKRTLGYNVNYKVKLAAYVALVRPILEYGSLI
jgi:hypothetical protein